MEAADFQPFFRNVFTEMELHILNHFETNQAAQVLKTDAKFFLSKEEESQKQRLSLYLDSHSPALV